MIVERILPAARKRLVTLDAGARLIDAAIHLGRSDVGLVVVCDAAGLMAGVLARTDLVRQMGRCRGGAGAIAVESVMSRDVASCHPDDFLHDVWAQMKRCGMKHIPVVERNGTPVGLLNARDVIEALLGEVESEELLLKDYVMSVGYQ